MPIALVLLLRPVRPGRLDTSLGRSAHACVMQHIQAHNPALATALHAESQLRPLTVTAPLTDAGSSVSFATPDQQYMLRVSATSHELEALLEGWCPETLIFGGAAWQVEQHTTDTSIHPLAGRSSYATLVELGQHATQTRWSFQLIAPVTFRRRGLNMPLPLPELFFGSLLERWNIAAPLQFPESLRDSLIENLAIEQLNIQSVRMLSKDRVPQLGAVGTLRYVLAGKDRSLIGVLSILAHFARYSGVGAGVTRGQGLVQLIAER